MNLPGRCDIAVVGGGPAGSTLAALLARSGRHPVLLERDRFPRRKVCGEFLSMEAQGLLASVGVLEALRAKGPASITRARFYAPSGRAAEFSLGGEAWGLSRWAFDEALFRHAQSCGANAFEGARLLEITGGPGDYRLRVELGPSQESVLAADVVVDARGRPIASAGAGPLFIGYKRSHRPRPGGSADVLRGTVEIHLFPGGYCGINEVEGGAVNVCLLARDGWLSGLENPRWESVAQALARQCPALKSRLDDLVPDGPATAVARIAFENPTPPQGLSLGDAAGMIAPLCGDGQSMALESALLLADVLTRSRPDAVERDWAQAWRRRFSTRLRMGLGLQGLLLRPWGAELAVGLGAVFPPASGFLLKATRKS